MQRLEVSGAVRPIYGSLGVKRLTKRGSSTHAWFNVKQTFQSNHIQVSFNCPEFSTVLFVDNKSTNTSNFGE